MNLQSQIRQMPMFLTGQVSFDQNGFTKQEIAPKIVHQQECYRAQRLLTLKNYIQYVSEYNKQISRKNKEVLLYNANVYSFMEQNKLQGEAQSLTNAFNNDIGKVSIDEYNMAAKLKNNNMGKPLLLLKKHIKVSPASEKIFAILMFVYGLQMSEKNAILQKCGATTVRCIQKLKVNHYELSRFKPKNGAELDYCHRTIRNHVNRLVDAGVLFGYEFNGHQKPVNYYVNSEILVIFDQQNRKTLNAENKLFNFQNLKTLPNNNSVTRTYLNKKEINENVDNHSPLKGIISQLPIGNDKNIYKNTQMRKQSHSDGQKNQAGAEKNCRISDYLYGKIEDTQCLMEDLTKGNYHKYRFLHRKHIEFEAISGNLTKTEFRELLLQIFLKMSSSIWTNTTPTIATWQKAFNIINEDLLLNNNNSIPNKQTLLYLFDNLVWRLTYAKRYFRKFTEFRPLYPSQYFDPTRKSKKSGGFAHTIEALKVHLKYQDEAKLRKIDQAKEAAKRNKRYKAIELVEKKLRQLKNGKINLSDLHDYVNNNQYIPQDVRVKLPEYIQRIYQD